MNIVSTLIKYDSFQLNEMECLEMYSYLIKSKLLYRLRDGYIYRALQLIKDGKIDEQGNILIDGIK